MDVSKHKVDLITRGGYLHEKYRVPPQLIVELLDAVTKNPREAVTARGQVEVATGEGSRRQGTGALPLPGRLDGASQCLFFFAKKDAKNGVDTIKSVSFLSTPRTRVLFPKKATTLAISFDWSLWKNQRRKQLTYNLAQRPAEFRCRLCR
jgi:hypothetical protein